MTALAFGYLSAAEALVRRGASVDNIAAAAGLGRLADAAQLLTAADPESRHRALALGGATRARGYRSASPRCRRRPKPIQPGWKPFPLDAVASGRIAGHDAVVRLLVERGARLDIKDTIYQGTPLGWAIYGGQTEIEQYLRAPGHENGGVAWSLRRSDDAEVRQTVQDELNGDCGQQQAHEAG